MSPRRGRMPRPKAAPLVTKKAVARILASPALGPSTHGVGLTYPPEAISPLPKTDIGQPGARAVAVLSPGESVYGMLSWLSSRSETLQVGVNHDPADLAALADEFCLANAISRPKSKKWPERVVIPGAAEREAVRPTPPPQPERPKEDPVDRQTRLAKVREKLRSRGPVEHNKAPEVFSTYDPEEEQDQSGRTAADRVAELGHGALNASPPLGFSGGYAPVPFDDPG